MVATSEEHEHQENQDNLNEISKEKDDAKPPISADTFGSNGGNDSETSGLETPAKKVVDNGNGSALIFLVGYGTPRALQLWEKIGIGDVLELLDSGDAYNFAQPNAGIRSEVVVGLPEKFQEGDMVDALLRVVEQKSSGNWKELDNESEDRKVERDAEREGEQTILETFGSDRVRNCYALGNRRWKKEKGVVLSPRQLKAEEEKECWLQQRKTGLRSFWSLSIRPVQSCPGSFAHRRIWDPGIKSAVQFSVAAANTLFPLPPSTALDITQHPFPSSNVRCPGRNRNANFLYCRTLDGKHVT
ncbi:hypothetical protein Tco_1548230 [Tanacetum coccineum]